MDIQTKPIPGATEHARMVYFRGIKASEIAELPQEALNAIDDMDKLVVVTNGDGQKLAIIEGREAAFAAAEAYKLEPVSVH